MSENNMRSEASLESVVWHLTEVYVLLQVPLLLTHTPLAADAQAVSYWRAGPNEPLIARRYL
jgi:hypothetical protein